MISRDEIAAIAKGKGLTIDEWSGKLGAYVRAPSGKRIAVGFHPTKATSKEVDATLDGLFPVDKKGNR